MFRHSLLSSRVREIITVLMLEGLSFPLAQMKVTHCASLSCRLHCTWRRWSGKGEPVLPWPIALRNALIKLGPAFVKIGQILSVRTDLIPAELAAALHTLQSDVPPVETAQIQALIEQELGKSIEDSFSSFDPTPLAAGSVAQVHRATDKQGRDLVLKVKRPGIDKTVQDDLEILVWLAGKLHDYLPESRPYHPVEAAKELKAYTLRELDFRQEAKVATEVRHAFQGWNEIRIPEVYRSTPHLIAMEYIESVSLDDIEQIEHWNLDRRQLMRIGLNAVLAQIFDFGLFHADPHPGNLHVTPKGEIVLLDFGIFGRLNKLLLKQCALLMWSLVKGDVELASLFLLRMATLEPGADTIGFRGAIEERYQAWKGSSVAEYGFARLLYEEFSIGAHYGVIFPSNLVLLSKAMLTIEGVALTVDPELDISKEAQPYFKILQKKMFSFKELKSSLERSFPLWWELAEGLPIKLAEALEKQLKTPAPQVLTSVQPVTESKAEHSIFAAALILAGTWMLIQRFGFSPWGISLFGGFVFLAGCFLELLISIQRKF